MSTEESRQFHEMTKFFERHPELKNTANAHMLHDWAKSSGGEELISVEWLELQLENPELRNSLAVQTPRETSEQATYRWLTENPAQNCKANEQMILERLSWSDETVEQAVAALGNQLAFNQEVHEEHISQLEQQEREQLVDLLARNHSLSPMAQQMYRNGTLKRASLEELRQMGRNHELRKQFTSISDQALKHVAHQEAVQRRAQHIPDRILPVEITAQVIRAASSRQVYEWQNRYGNELLNARLQGRS